MEDGIKNYHICIARGIWTSVVRWFFLGFFCLLGFLLLLGFFFCLVLVFFYVFGGVFSSCCYCYFVWFNFFGWLFAVGVLLLFRWKFFNAF